MVTVSILYFVGLASEDEVAEYYQQQIEMLDGFTEMDALAERGYLPGMSKVYMIFVYILVKNLVTSLLPAYVTWNVIDLHA